MLLVPRPPFQHVLAFFITYTITVFPRPRHAAVPFDLVFGDFLSAAANNGIPILLNKSIQV
jgi:hypothetical protein